MREWIFKYIVTYVGLAFLGIEVTSDSEPNAVEFVVELNLGEKVLFFT